MYGQYIQNTKNKVEIERVKNNHKCISAEGHQSDISVHPKGVCMHGHHIWKVRISLICQLTAGNADECDWIIAQKQAGEVGDTIGEDWKTCKNMWT